MTERPNVGIGVLVVKDGLVLLGERRASHGANTWQLPGGHLEFGDSFEETATRELAEETGLTDVLVQGIVSVYNERDYGKHYVNIGVLVEWKSGEPYAAEPEKSANWHWHDPHDLPSEMFAASRKVIENWLAGTLYTS